MKKRLRKYSTTDYTINDLPKTRFDLFKDIIKNNYSFILLLGLICLLISLPLIINRYINLYTLSIAAENNNYFEVLKSSTITKDALDIPFLVIIGIGLSGIYKIINKFTYNEGFLFKLTFVKGLKDNIKDFISIFLIYSLLKFLLDYLGVSYIESNSFIYYLLKVVLYVIITPILFIELKVCSTYNDNVFKKIWVSIILYIKNLFFILFIYLILIAPLFLLFINITYIQLFVPIVYAMFYIPIGIICFVNFMNNILDKDINEANFKELVNKGLKKEEPVE